MTFEPFFGPFWPFLSHFWPYPGLYRAILGPFWDQNRSNGSFWGDFGPFFGSIRGHFGVTYHLGGLRCFRSDFSPHCPPLMEKGKSCSEKSGKKKGTWVPRAFFVALKLETRHIWGQGQQLVFSPICARWQQQFGLQDVCVCPIFFGGVYLCQRENAEKTRWARPGPLFKSREN